MIGGGRATVRRATFLRPALDFGACSTRPRRRTATTGAFTYDTNGRLAQVSWTGPGGLITSDQVTRRTGGDVIGFVTDGVDHHGGDDYTYDNAGRLTQAWMPGAHYSYAFANAGSCPAPAAYKNTNRSSMTVTPTGGTAVTTNYCYDHADRLTSVTDPVVGTIAYDAHGNTTEIFGETHTYDAADRHLSTVKDDTTVTYVRDATDRIVERKLDGVTTARYGATGSGDAPEFTTDDTDTLLEVTYALPGGALLTTRPGGNVWSYPNIHGDVVATADQAGAKQGPTRVYDPYGNPLPGSDIPDNSAGNFDYGWLGQHQRPVEHEPELQPIIEMGARQYSPLLGRFLEVDPIEGGSANDYDYVNADPVNDIDLEGTAPCGKGVSKSTRVVRIAGYNLRCGTYSPRRRTGQGYRKICGKHFNCSNAFARLRMYEHIHATLTNGRRTTSRSRGGRTTWVFRRTYTTTHWSWRCAKLRPCRVRRSHTSTVIVDAGNRNIINAYRS